MHNIIRAKCLVFGDTMVGKTSLIQSFLSDGSNYSKNYNMTLGLDIETKMINVPDTNYSVELYLYDCSGKDFYRPLVVKMSSQPSLVLLVYDVTSENSFNLLTELYEQVKGHQKDDHLKGVLFGNKTDLDTRRLVSPKAGREMADKLGLVYFEGSAKEQQGVEEPYFYMVNEWFKIYTDSVQAMKHIS